MKALTGWAMRRVPWTSRAAAADLVPSVPWVCQVPVTASQVFAGGAGVPYMWTLTVWASAAQQVKMMRVRSQPPLRTGVAKPVISTLRPLMASSLSCWTRVVKSVRVIGRGEVAGSADNPFCCLTDSLPAWEAVQRAARAAGNLHAYRSARDMADNLRIALESRGVIDQAKGILMARHKLTADQAFQVLAQMAMQTNRKLRAIADEVVHIGELPDRLAPRS